MLSFLLALALPMTADLGTSFTQTDSDIEVVCSEEEWTDCYFLNAEKVPAVISPMELASSVSTQHWIQSHRKRLEEILNEYGALLLRGFPIEEAQGFANVVQTVLNLPLINYRGGEGSRKKIVDGVYTSTEAPPSFQIPLHNELTCTDNPPSYICFYCEVAPESGSGQTILGSTEKITYAMQRLSEIWNVFAGRTLKYISRHPPEGNFFTLINNTHKTWQESFETGDKQEVERICREKGFEFHWLGEWIEVIRRAPAIQEPDQTFHFPYWFNQAHLYHSNPRIRGGCINDALANLLYCDPTTRQYDVEFEDGTPLPQWIVYGIYDVLEQETIRFDWQKNDVLILNNRKILHGRAPYSGPRRILVSMVQ